MILIPQSRRAQGMGLVSTPLLADSSAWQGSYAPAIVLRNPFSAAAAALSPPTPGQTTTDSAGNVYTYGSSGWQLTGPASSGTVPTSSAFPTPASASATPSFPVNPVVGQTYTDAAGNIWTFGGAGGWAITAAASSASFLTGQWISGVPNYWLIGGGVLALVFLMKGGRR